MIPTLFEIPIFGGIPIHSFGLMLAVAFITSSFVLKRLFLQQKFPAEVAERLVLLAAVFGLLGSKLYYLLFEAFDRFIKDPLGMLFSGAGLTWYGGFVLAFLAIIWIVRKNKLPLLRSLDLVSMVLPLGYGLGRIGCHLAGDGDYGKPYDGIFGTDYSRGIVPPSEAFYGTEIAKQYPNGLVPDHTLVHPTPLYETVLSLAVFGILYFLHRRSPKPGSILASYLVLGGLARFGVEFLRINPIVAWGLSGAQLISLVMIALGVVWNVSLMRRGPDA